MLSQTKNIILLVVLIAIMVFTYIFFIRSPAEEEDLVSSSDTGISDSTEDNSGNVIAQEFLDLLLNVKSIKLNDAIFNDPAFATLRDSSILLVPDGNEGRPNPFAPIGVDNFPVTEIPVTAPESETTETPETPPN